ATQDQFLAVLARLAGDAALGRHARLAHRVATAVAATFTTTQRVVDRVHRLGTRVRADAHVAAAAGLANADVDPVEVAQLADRRAAFALHAAHFTAGKNDDAPLAFLRAQTSDAAGGADELAALAGVHLDVVDFQTAGDVGQRDAVTQFRRSVGAAHNCCADLEAVGAEDVALLAVGV